MTGANCSGQIQPYVEAKLAEVKKLQSDRHYRHGSGLFYVEGVRNFVQIFDNGFDVETILFSEKLLIAPLARKLVRRARRGGVKSIPISPEQFRSISRTERASGVGAIVRQRWFKLHDVLPQAGLFWVVIETVRSPGNLGSLIRTSEAVGGAGFIFISRRSNPFDPDVVRASVGALFHQKFVRTSIDPLNHWIRRHHCHVIGASPNGTTDLYEFNYPPSTLLLLGEERQGLTQQQLSLCQDLVRIPMVGTADSLNLAVAGSLIMYEVYRSRRH